MRVLVKVLTEQNSEHWAKLAQEHSRAELIKLVKDQGGAAATKQTQTKIFKLHEDQAETVKSALDKAKQTAGNVSDSAALGYLCLDFVSNSTSLLQKMDIVSEQVVADVISHGAKRLGRDAVLKILDEAFSEELGEPLNDESVEPAIA